MSTLTMNERAGVVARGEVELEARDEAGRVVQRFRDHNQIKIFMKEAFAHRLAHSKVWDPDAAAWVTHGIDLDEFAAKYIVLGASFDADGAPLDVTDTRFYALDEVTGGYVPTSLSPGAEFGGGLINAVPIAEPERPLKRVERVYFEPSYQPAGTPLLEPEVRAVNNVLVLETVLEKEEYNGFGVTAGDFFTITEVALVAAAELTDPVGACECDPRDLFLTGTADGTAQLVSLSGGATVSIDSSESEVDLVKEGDQIKLVVAGGTDDSTDVLEQVNPFYLVTSKLVGGRDLVLDRTPADADGQALTGQAGLLRDGFRILAHRILPAPFKKSMAFSVTIRWRIVMG